MLSLNQKRLEEVLAHAKEFEKTQAVEDDIAELLEAYKTISDAYASLKQVFVDSEWDSVEGSKIKVVKYESGARFNLIDPKLAPPELLEVKLNTKAVEQFVKENNIIPEGIEEKLRSTSVRITLK